jgi:glycosyltransferase involved in cell wall biosynthesis
MKSNNYKLSIFMYFFFCIWKALRLVIKKEKIDLVITYDPLKTGLIGTMICRLIRAKLAPEINGVYTSPAQWIDSPNNLSTEIKKICYKVIMRYVLKRSDGIRLLYKGQIDSLREVVKGKIIRDFPCFVPIDNFYNIRENKEVLFIGFPFKIKGVDILVKAFKIIANDYPAWKLKILGWFPNPKELNEAIDGHPQICHHPPVKYNEIPEHIGSCAIFVLPSRSEAMGRVLVEAMAAGKPRIGSNVDGIPTVINDGVDGLLFESENVDDLADKLSILMSNADLRHKLGRAGEIRAKEKFSKEIYFKNLFNFYNEVLGK